MLINEKEIPIIWRTNPKLRKIHMRVNSYGQIEITTRLPIQFDVEDLVKKYSPFIQRQMAQIKKSELPTFEHGSYVWILGEKHLVLRSTGIKEIMKTVDGLLIPKNYSLEQIRAFLKGLLFDALDMLMEFYSKKYKFSPIRIEVKETYSCWSKWFPNECIEYSIALVFLPLDLVEYCIIWRLCNIKYPNQKVVWNHIERILPDAKKKRKMLHSYHLEWLLERLGVKRR